MSAVSFYGVAKTLGETLLFGGNDFARAGIILSHQRGLRVFPSSAGPPHPDQRTGVMAVQMSAIAATHRFIGVTFA
jgi:hypothetical protein